MKINKKHIHRGEILQQVVAESGLSVTKVVQKAGFSRSSFYNHTTDPELPVDILLKYGTVLRYDFIENFPELLGNHVKEIIPKYTAESKAETIDEALKQRDAWREKYFELLEKYQAALEQQIKKDR